MLFHLFHVVSLFNVFNVSHVVYIFVFVVGFLRFLHPSSKVQMFTCAPDTKHGLSQADADLAKQVTPSLATQLLLWDTLT